MCPFSGRKRTDPTLKRGKTAQVQVQSARKSAVPQPSLPHQELEHSLQGEQVKHDRFSSQIHSKQRPQRQQSPTVRSLLEKTANRPLQHQRTPLLLRQIRAQRFLEQEVQHHPHQGLKPQGAQRSLKEERRVPPAELKIPAEEDGAAAVHQGSSFSPSKVIEKEGGRDSREEE